MQDLAKILEAFERVYARSEKLNALNEAYWEIMNPCIYAPSFEHDELNGFMYALEVTEPELHSELSCWLWDGMVIPQTMKFNNKEFWIKDFDSYKLYLYERFQP